MRDIPYLLFAIGYSCWLPQAELAESSLHGEVEGNSVEGALLQAAEQDPAVLSLLAVGHQ